MIAKAKKIFLWALIVFFLGANFAVLFNPQKAKAYNYPSGIVSDRTTGTTDSKAAQLTWEMDLGKIITAVFSGTGTSPNIPYAEIETKFIVTINGNPINSTTVHDGQKSQSLDTFSKDSAYGFDGSTQEQATPNASSATFQIFSNTTKDKFAKFTLIDPITPVKSSNITYNIQPISRIQHLGIDTIAVLPSFTIAYKAGTPASTEKDLAWYNQHYFPVQPANFVLGGDNTFSVKSGADAVIHIPKAGERPAIDFALTNIVKNDDSSAGHIVLNSNDFYFVSQEPNAKNLAIKLNDGTSLDDCTRNLPFRFGIISNVDNRISFQSFTNNVSIGQGVDWYFANPNTWEIPKDNVYYQWLNKVYTGGPYGPGTTAHCPNSGDLTPEAQKKVASNASDPPPTTDATDDACGTAYKPWVQRAIAKVLCATLRGIGEMGRWLINTFGISTVINAYHQDSASHLLSAVSHPLSIKKAHAAVPETLSESSIKNALNGDPEWVLKAWKTVLAIANIFIVIVLLFLAITNILNIQYDTYAIKKSLPYLILGIILANFSIFITKMLVDAANVLTSTFTGGSPGTMIENVINAVSPTDGTPGFMTTNSNGTLILAILFAFFAIIAFLILGFLFYVRYIVILTLTIAAPLAFVLMAFPPTQGVFKQWSSWYFKFIFMKPISIFFIWLASEVIAGGGGNHITAWAIAVFLVIAAIIVPFKLGGFVMQGWGAFGKWASGTKKEGWSRKPVDAWIGRTKRDVGTKAINRFPIFGMGAAKEKQSEANRQAAMDRGSLKWEKGKTGVATERERNEAAARDLKTLQDKRKRQVWEGTLPGTDNNWWQRFLLKRRTGSGTQGELMNKLLKSMTESQKATEAVSKSAQWDLFAKLSTDSRLSNNVQADLKDMLNQQTKNLEGFNLEADGSINFTGNLDAKIGDYDAGIELLQQAADRETNPDLKARMTQNIAELRGRTDNFRANNPRVGMEKFELKDDGDLNFTGATDTDWADYIQTSDVLLLQSKAEAESNPEKSRKLYQSAKELRNRAAQFQKENPNFKRQKEDGTFETVDLNYGAFLDRNVNGRILKILTPLLVDEGHTNAQNENTEGLLKALFVGGGGFGNVRYANPEAVKKFVQGRYSELTSNEINAVMAQLGGTKERMTMGPDRSDSQELLYGFLKGMTGDKFLGKDLWKNLLSKLEGERKGSLGEFILEFSNSQRKRGVKKTILDKIGEDNNLDLSEVKNASQLYEKISSEDLIGKDEIPVEVIQELIPTGMGGGFQSQREFYRRTLTQLMQMPEFGGGRNPAMFAGIVRNMKPNDRYSTLRSQTPSGGTNQPNPLIQADQADQQFQQLSQSSADQLIQANGGNIDRTIQQYANGINYAVNLPVTFEGKIVSSGVTLGQGKLEDVIRHLAVMDPNLSIDDVEAQLKTIDANIRLNRRGNPRTASTFIRNAQEIVKADETIDTLASYKTAQEYMPYTKTAPRDESKLNEGVNALTAAATTLTEAAQSFASSGGQKTIDKDNIDRVLAAIEKSRGGDIDINIDNLRKSLSSNDFAPTTTVLDKLLTGFQTMKQAIAETKSSKETIDDNYLMKAMIRSFQSLEARQAVRSQPAQPQVGRTQTPQASPSSTPPAPPSEPVGPGNAPDEFQGGNIPQ